MIFEQWDWRVVRNLLIVGGVFLLLYCVVKIAPDQSRRLIAFPFIWFGILWVRSAALFYRMRTASEKGMGILWGTRVYAYTKVLLEMTGGLALLTLGLAVLVNPNDTLDIVIKHIFSYWGLAATGASLTLLGMRRVFGVFVLADEEYEFPDSADAFKFRDSIQGALMTLFGAGILFLTYLWRK